MPWISVCTNWKNQAVFLECSTPHGSHFVSCLWGLMELEIGYQYESKEGCWVWSWGESAVSFKITISAEAITDPLRKAGLTHLVRCRKTASTGKEILAEFRNSVSSASSGSTHMSSFQLTGSHFFPINALTLAPRKTPENLGIQYVL